MSEQHKCCGTIWRQGWLSSTSCGKNAKVERDGKHYCGIHDPAKREARYAKWQAEWDAKRAAEEARNAAIAERDRKASEYDRLRAENAELLIQVDELISQIENTYYKLNSDPEALRQAKGCVEYARQVKQRNSNGS